MSIWIPNKLIFPSILVSPVHLICLDVQGLICVHSHSDCDALFAVVVVVIVDAVLVAATAAFVVVVMAAPN